MSCPGLLPLACGAFLFQSMKRKQKWLRYRPDASQAVGRYFRTFVLPLVCPFALMQKDQKIKTK